jgi:hypothetical protein
MLVYPMAESFFQTASILESLVDRLLSQSGEHLHSFSTFVTRDMAWALRMPRTHAYISVALELFQCIDQSISKDFNIGPVARHVWTVKPNNVG